MPDGWVGEPPGLPQEVIAELARRAKEAERLERLARQGAEQKKPQAVSVRVASQPTFTRYVFDVPEQTTVSVDRAKERLTLSFDAPIVFDLTDAVAALPPTVAAINTEVEQDSSLVRFSFLSKVDLRTFRDGNGYVVDVVDAAEGKADQRAKAAGKNLVLPKLPLESEPPGKPATENGPPPGATETQTQPAMRTNQLRRQCRQSRPRIPRRRYRRRRQQLRPHRIRRRPKLTIPNPADTESGRVKSGGTKYWDCRIRDTKSAAPIPATRNPATSDAAKAKPAPQDQDAVVPPPAPPATKPTPLLRQKPSRRSNAPPVTANPTKASPSKWSGRAPI